MLQENGRGVEMKRLLSILITSLLLGACGIYQKDENKIDQEADSQNQAHQPTQPTLTENNDKKLSELEFSIQESDRMMEVSPMTDDTLNHLSQLTLNQSQAIGRENDLGIDYSGLILQSEQADYGVFMISNRTGNALSNLNLKLTIQFSEGEVLVEDYHLYLDEALFGTLDSGTAMPLYLPLDLGQSTIESMNPDNIEVEIQNLTIEEESLVDEDTSMIDLIDQGLKPGYNPSLVAELQAQDQLVQKIEIGDVPPLEFDVPEGIHADPVRSEAVKVVDDQMLNTIRGLSEQGEPSLYWTGVLGQDPASTEYITLFLLANRTGENYENLNFSLSFGEENGGLIVEQASQQLAREEYGEIKDETIVPVFVHLPATSQATLEELIDPKSDSQVSYRFDSFNGVDISQ